MAEIDLQRVSPNPPHIGYAPSWGKLIKILYSCEYKIEVLPKKINGFT
jgi:hypothetical protein